MADYESIGEVGRALDSFKEDIRGDITLLRDDVKQLSTVVDTKTVGVELYKVRHSALEDRIGIIERAIDRQNEAERLRERAREKEESERARADAERDRDRRRLYWTVGLAVFSGAAGIVSGILSAVLR